MQRLAVAAMLVGCFLSGVFCAQWKQLTEVQRPTTLPLSSEHVWTGVFPREAGALGKRPLASLLQRLDVERARALAFADRPVQERRKRNRKMSSSTEDIKEFYASLAAYYDMGYPEDYGPSALVGDRKGDFERQRFAELLQSLEQRFSGLTPLQARAALVAEMKHFALQSPW